MSVPGRLCTLYIGTSKSKYLPIFNSWVEIFVQYYGQSYVDVLYWRVWKVDIPMDVSGSLLFYHMYEYLHELVNFSR
jgi:hypothetical protein